MIEATLTVMADKGMAEFSIADVATRSGVHESSIYRRWGTRDALIVETLLDNSEMLIPVPDTGAVRTDLTALVTEIIAYLSTDRGRALNQVLAAGGDDSRWAAVRLEFWSTRLARTRPIIERAIARGEIAADADPQLILETLIAPLQFRALIVREPFDTHFAAALVDLVLDGVGISAPPS
ncbi:TetR/AcrR family transcriptional regulator [Gordonia sp. CPCC 205515]|uniref:TetR/AcrR family transcriptional regulator n=1 Tax=Gordonia sp. CPCC 205515 TaxID=3140791 RepID=UPI003AF3C195